MKMKIILIFAALLFWPLRCLWDLQLKDAAPKPAREGFGDGFLSHHLPLVPVASSVPLGDSEDQYLRDKMNIGKKVYPKLNSSILYAKIGTILNIY